MKTISINKHELVEALGYLTHVDFSESGWSWQVSFNPKAQEPEAVIELANPTINPDVPYTMTSANNYDPAAFADLDGYSWGEPGTLPRRGMADVKELEQIHVSEDVRDRVVSSLKKHVELGGTTYSVRYY